MTFIFILNTGCGTHSEIEDRTEENVEINDIYNNSNSWLNISLKEMMNHVVLVSSERISEINLVESDEYVQINNNIINGNFVFSYKKDTSMVVEKRGKMDLKWLFFMTMVRGK